MISQDTYQNTKKDIDALAEKYALRLRSRILESKYIQPAIKQTYTAANDYHTEYVSLAYNRLQEVGMNAANYYAPDLTERQKQQEVSAALDTMTHSKYYGLTLPQRLSQSNIKLRYNIQRSAVTGAKLETRLTNLTRVFTETYPHGAHKTWDTRLFLAEAVRLEHEMARRLVVYSNIRLIRWTVSHTHKQEDICDKLARAVDPEVVTLIEEANLDLNPEGLYLVEKLPLIPHPNCQCVVKYQRERVRRKPMKPRARKNLIQRIIKALFK